MIKEQLELIQFDGAGLVPVITQDAETNEVLMLAYMNEEALAKTLETGRVHYYSRSRQSLWQKGETSGNVQLVKEIRYDCDGDALLIQAEQIGSACHTGHRSCFYRNLQNETTSPLLQDAKALYSPAVLLTLYNTILNRKNNPVEGSYTNYLFNKGIDKILKKVGEESAEVIIAAKNNSKDEMVYEISDLMYHLSVLMVNNGLQWQDIFEELSGRARK